MITDEQIARVFNKHGANFFAGARELIALAQQEPAHDEVPMPQNADQAQLMALLAENWLKHNAPERLKEPAQAVPYAWHVPPMVRMYFGKYAQLDAESEAKHVGGTAKAIPLYTRPTPLDSDTRKPLTDEQMRECAQAMTAEPLTEGWPELIKFARAIEKSHGIGAGE